MNLTVKGKHIDVGDALRGHVEEQLTAVTEKYFSNPIDATVVFAHEAHLYRADISVRVGRGIMLQSSAEATDIYPAFETAAEKVGKRLRRSTRGDDQQPGAHVQDPRIGTTLSTIRIIATSCTVPFT